MHSEHFKQSTNITSQKMSIKMLHCTALIRNVYCTITEGYKAVLEDTGRGGTYEKGVMPEAPRINCRQRTCTGNWKGLARTRRGRTLLHAKWSHLHVREASGIISEPYILEHVQRKMVRCAKTQTLFVQMSLPDVDSVRARKILSMQMAVL